MTITLAPETETLLRERADHDGQVVDALANMLLVGSLSEEEAKERRWQPAMLDAGLLTRMPP